MECAIFIDRKEKHIFQLFKMKCGCYQWKSVDIYAWRIISKCTLCWAKCTLCGINASSMYKCTIISIGSHLFWIRTMFNHYCHHWISKNASGPQYYRKMQWTSKCHQKSELRLRGQEEGPNMKPKKLSMKNDEEKKDPLNFLNIKFFIYKIVIFFFE